MRQYILEKYTFYFLFFFLQIWVLPWILVCDSSAETGGILVLRDFFSFLFSPFEEKKKETIHVILNCNVGEDSQESLGQQRNPTCPS